MTEFENKEHTPAERTDWDNGYLGYVRGVPAQYYDYSGAAWRGYQAAKAKHAADFAECEAAIVPAGQRVSLADWVG